MYFFLQNIRCGYKSNVWNNPFLNSCDNPSWYLGVLEIIRMNEDGSLFTHDDP